MARVTCTKVSTGKALNLTAAPLLTTWTTIAEAPDFSIPDPATRFPDRDPLSASRAIRPGEVYFLTPIYARNLSGATVWVEAKLILEDLSEIEWFRQSIPTLETIQIPIQGRSLLKRTPAGTYGDRLQLRAGTSSAIDAWGSAQERLSAEHIGVV
jgi:hypothetical protein